MFRLQWLRSALGVAQSRRDRRRLAARKSRSVRLMLESLEERLTPSGGDPTVTQTAGGYTALTGLVKSDTAANTHYIIQITSNFTFDSGGQVSISKLGAGSSMTLEGQGGANFTLTGNGNRLFDIAKGQNVTFTDLTLTKGSIAATGTSNLGFAQGGSILDQGGNVTLSKVAVIGNSVTGSEASGGGIFVSAGGNLTVRGNSTIEGNLASGNNGSKGGQGGSAFGGGVSVVGSSTVQISDSTIINNSANGGAGGDQTAPPKTTAVGAGQGGFGGAGQGGGLYVIGSGWTVTLTGDTLSGNSAIGGQGGKGLAGSNATAANTTGGNGTPGGGGGSGDGGAAYFSVRTASGFGGLGSLTIQNDTANPSTWIDNQVRGGAGGTGAAGGTSTGTAKNANGGAGGTAGRADGGALYINTSLSSSEETLTANVVNTTFYGNANLGGLGGSGGSAGTGGSGAAGTAGTNQSGGGVRGGGLDLVYSGGGAITMINSTVANNAIAGGNAAGGATQGTAAGSGIDLFLFGTTPTAVYTFDNNTITQNKTTGSTGGAGFSVQGGNPALFNNLIQGNLNGSTEDDLETTTPLTNATNNFIVTISAGAVNSSTNTIGNTTAQLVSAVGVDSSGKPTGGPIYYPLLSGVASVGAGTTSVVSTIANLEGTTSANAADEIGDFRTSSGGTIDLGAVELGTSLAPPPPPPPPPGPPPSPQPVASYTDLVNAVAADTGSGANYVLEITSNFTFDSGGQVSISKLGTGSTMTIEGQGGSNFTLTGNGNRLFDIAKGQNVTFADLTLTGGGSVDFGGAILNRGGNVTLSKASVQGNTASGAGGGIFVSAGGNLTVQGGSTIQSNHAIGTLHVTMFGNTAPAAGGGVYVSGSGAVQISDSTLSNNSVQGGQGANATSTLLPGGGGGDAEGGGLYVAGNGWTVTLTGDTFSGNTAVGGNGGTGAAGSNATIANTSGGNGASGGNGGGAVGGAAFFSAATPNFVAAASASLTILNDSANPSTWIGNSVQGGTGGKGGAGGASLGLANNSKGGDGGSAGPARGGAVALASFGSAAFLFGSSTSSSVNVNIGNTTFYGNKATGGGGGGGGVAGTGGSGTAGKAGKDQSGGNAGGGGLALEGFDELGLLGFNSFNFPGFYNLTMVNSTVANNTVTGGAGAGGATQGSASAGGLRDADLGTAAFDNNTIAQNALSGSTESGAGVLASLGFVGSPPPATSPTPALVNNLIQSNSGSSSAHDLDTDGTTLSNATDNFIGTISTDAVSTSTNTVGDNTAQLASAVGVDSSGKPTGGPIYYPLLSGVASLGAGSTSVLDAIAAVEGTTAANATDEIGNPRTSSGSIDLGAVQTKSSSTSSAPSITTQPSNQTVAVGQTAAFTAAASGNPTPTVRWQVSSDGGKNFTNLSDGANVSGSTTLMLTLSNVTLAMSGNEYQAVFTNTAGSATTNAATLTVGTTAPPTITTQPTNQTVADGGTATFTAAANGVPTPTVQWQVSTDGGKTFHNISGATSPTLTLNDLTTSVSGDELQAVFTNSVGSITTTAVLLTVNPAVAPAITGNPTSLTATVGQTVTFTASASGSPTPAVQWQASVDGGKTFMNLTGATSPTLTLNNVSTQISGSEFRAVFTNSAGSVTSSVATLTVQAPPLPPAPLVLKVPPLLAFFDSLLGGVETVNADGTETITDRIFGITLLVSTFDHSGNLVSVDLFGSINVTFLFTLFA